MQRLAVFTVSWHYRLVELSRLRMKCEKTVIGRNKSGCNPDQDGKRLVFPVL
jgi:hypothetical protein